MYIVLDNSFSSNFMYMYHLHLALLCLSFKVFFRHASYWNMSTLEKLSAGYNSMLKVTAFQPSEAVRLFF